MEKNKGLPALFNTDHLLTVFCCIFFTGFLIGYLLTPETEFSEMENRYLTTRPALSLSGLSDGSFMSSFEAYTGDQLPLRNGLIKLKSIVERIELKRENNGIIRGKNGQLFEKAFSYHKNLSRNEEILLSFLKEADREIYVGLIPNSFEIQREQLPKGTPCVSEKKAIAGFYEELSGLPLVHTINLYQPLYEHRGERLYYYTDHHWTTDGAYIGYVKILEELSRQKQEELRPVDITKLARNAAEGFYGTYYSKYKGISIEPDELVYYETPIESYVNQDTGESYDGLYDLSKLEVYDKYAMFLYGNPGTGMIETGRSDRDKTLIIFKDSYSNCLIPFLSYNYGRIVTVDLRYFGGSVSELLSENQEADVLILYNFMQFSEDSNFYKLVR